RGGGARGGRGGAQPGRAPPQEVELDVLVAERAGIRRAAGQVLGDERPHHRALEGIAEVEDVVRYAEPIRDGARVLEVVQRAAGAAAVAREAQRDADDVVSRLDAAGRRDRAIDAAAHRHDDPHATSARAVARTWATSRGSRSITASISLGVVVGPRLRRSPPRADSSSSPIARSTCEGSGAPAAHAEPSETATPARSRSTSKLSPAQPGKRTFTVFGSRGPAAGPWRITSGTLVTRPSHSRSRSAA